jgi:hypothetical protein
MTRPISSTASLTGHTFGAITVLRDLAAGGQARRVQVLCRCGRESSVIVRNLLEATRTRCKHEGCLDRQRELARTGTAVSA